MIRKTIFIFALLFLASCSKDGYISNVRTMRYIIRSEINDVRNQPIHTIEKEIENRIGDEKWITFINDLDHFQIAYPADYPAERPVSMRDMDILQSSSCPSFGIIEPKEMPFKGGNGSWAKMPINRAYEDKLFCMPPYTDKCTEEAYWSSGCNDGTAAYAFCAEKDGKAVAICIQQMTDDEAMAKEIFESFRWTD